MASLHAHEGGSGPAGVLLPPGPGLDGSVFWPGAQAGLLDDVVFSPELHHPRDWGALGALAAPERYWPALIAWLRRTGTPA